MSRSFRKTVPIIPAKGHPVVSNLYIKNPKKINGLFNNCVRCVKGEVVISSCGRTMCKRIQKPKSFY